MILLLMGGFILSTALEHSGVHKTFCTGNFIRIGNEIQTADRRFLLSSALCSMWISNTATTLMLLPIASAIIIHKKQIAAPVLMAIACKG